jgi:hypothetical protein
VDTAIGSITISGPRLTALDFSIPYYITAAAFIANTPRELSRWAALLRPYNLNTWIPIIIAVVFAGPVLWLIVHQYHRSVSVLKCYETSFKIFINQGLHSQL